MPNCKPTLTILDVGHGNAAILREADSTLIVDVGGRADLLEFLQECGTSKIDTVIISHSDADHIGGLVGLLAAGFEIGCVHVNSDADKKSEAWRDLVVALEDARRRKELQFQVGLSCGSIVTKGFSKCVIDIIAPTPEIIAFGAGSKDRRGRRITSNTISACIRISYNGKPVALLTGDMDEVSLDSCIDAGSDLRAPILVFPHHGGLHGGAASSEFTTKLIDQTKPDRVLFSIGRNKYDNPRREVVDVVKRTGAYIACTQLSKHCADNPAEVTGIAVAQSHSAGSRKGHCCAGTITIHLDETELFSTHAAHINFVENLTSPICR